MLGAITTAPEHAGRLFAGFAVADALAVVCLCAAWCDSCRQFRAIYNAIARADPSTFYVRIDIEDDEAVVGDVDIETFPTIGVYRGERLVHFGAALPQRGNIARLVSAAAERDQSAADAPEAMHRLAQLLRDRSQGQSRGQISIGKNDGTSLASSEQTVGWEAGCPPSKASRQPGSLS